MHNCTRYEQACPCVNKRASARRKTNEDNAALIHEPPVRDIPKKSDHNPDSGPYSGQFPPPEPPNGEYGLWELQFCKWWGWTWVRRGDKEVAQQNPKEYDTQYAQTAPQRQSTAPRKQGYAPQLAESKEKSDPKKKSGGFFSCFKRQNEASSRRPQRTPARTFTAAQQTKSDDDTDASVILKGPGGSDVHVNDFCCCCCCDPEGYSPCNQICCPCMCHNQICCCCSVPEASRQKNDAKNRETQTQKEVREQATKMSEIHVPKQKPYAYCRCKCCQRVCPCRRVCCPCCPCRRNNVRPKSDETVNETANKRRTSVGDNDKIVNYCLTRDMRKPSLDDLLKFKGANFSTLHKSLDLLLKNNINIMNLFNDKKVFKCEEKPNFLELGHNTSGSSINECLKRSDQEHCKLLTAVCDAILSSHKFDDEKYHPLTVTGSKSSDKSYFCESKDSQNSMNIFGNRGGLLEKILNDLNFPIWTQKNRSEINLQREIGVQVDKTPIKKIERSCHTYRTLGRLTKSRSKTFTSVRLPRRLDAFRNNLDLLKSGCNEVKGFKRNLRTVNFTDNSTNTDDNKKSTNDNKSSLINIFKGSDESISSKLPLPLSFEFSSNRPKETTPKFQTVEELLDSIDFNVNTNFIGTTSKNTLEQNGNNKNGFSSLLRSRKGDPNLLDTTSPPFTDYDLPFNVEEKKKEDNTKDKRGSFGR